MRSEIYDTIVAPATNIATQAISVIKVSGDKSFEVINSLIDKKITYESKPQLRKIYENDELIDEVLFIPFINKKSFTGEDVVEINCHGSILIVKKIIAMLIKKGCRLAKNGEFSQRAFLNGKINLIQAQGINDLIHSKNELALKISALNMSGHNNKLILKIKNQIIDVISKIQTSIDYPEYDEIEGSKPDELLENVIKIADKLKTIIQVSKQASTINDGIRTLILGEPNVGKSSILNALINEDKAIVSELEGTTRDIVEGQILLHNITLNLIDTAGIRKTKNKIESIGIQKAKSLIPKSDLILFVINDENFDIELYNDIVNRNHLIILNKSNELTKKDREKIKTKYRDIVFANAANGDVGFIIKAIEKKYINKDILKKDQPILINIEQIAKFELVLENIINASKSLENHIPIDLVNIDLYNGLEILNNLIGVFDTNEEIIDNIFRKYCLGK